MKRKSNKEALPAKPLTLEYFQYPAHWVLTAKPPYVENQVIGYAQPLNESDRSSANTVIIWSQGSAMQMDRQRFLDRKIR